MSQPASTALTNMRRSPYQSLAAILVLSISFFVTYIFVMLTFGTEKVLQYFETQPQVTAFFDVQAQEEQVKQAEATMRGKDYVKELRLITKDEALAIYREDNKDDPLLLQLVTADILPASLEVSAVNIEYLPQIETDLTALDGIEEVVFQKDIVDKLAKWTKTLRVAGLALVTLLLVTSILVIVVITSMKVSTRRTAIRIMRLIGASQWYIKAPFLWEGIYYGILGALFGWLATYTVLLYLTPLLINFLGDIPLLPVPVLTMLGLLGGGSLVGIFLGALASLIASGRYLKN